MGPPRHEETGNGMFPACRFPRAAMAWRWQRQATGAWHVLSTNPRPWRY